MNPLTYTELAGALFEEAGDALFLFDPESDDILAVNPMAIRLCGFSQQELLRTPVTWLYRFNGRPGQDRIRGMAQRSGIFHNQDGFELRTRDDRFWIPVTLTIARLHVKPKTLALITARDAREQRAAHERVRDVEAELRRVLSSVSDCLWSAEIDADGHWTYRFLSPVIERITGKSPDFFQAGAKHWWTVVATEDRPRCEQARIGWRKGISSQEEYRVVRPDGTVRWVRDTVRVSPAGGESRAIRLDGILTDITDRRKAEEALSRERSLLRSLIDSIPDLIVYKDRDGRLLGCNTAFEASVGKRERDLVGKTDTELFSSDIVQVNQLHEREVLAAGKPHRCEEHVVFPDGKAVLLDTIRVPFFGAENRLLGLIAIGRDITERKRDENLLKQTIESEREAHHQLKLAQSRLVQSEKLVSLGELVAGVAHEINNPLAFVSNNTVVLQRDLQSLRELLQRYAALDPVLSQNAPDAYQEIKDFAEEIDLAYTLPNIDGLLARSREGLSRIQQIVKSLREFARLDESELKEADLNAGVRSTLDIVRGEAKKKHLHLEVELAELPEVVCYPARVNQVILNLVANAIHASNELGTVTIRTTVEAGGVAIHVIDTGHGIAPEVLPRIFDPFFTTKPVGQGTGLGLSISHQIVEDHGGTIHVESQRGQGAHFTVFLPLVAAPKKPRR